ncbi:hypothetical protein [Arenimonas metalli]|uniref:DUF4197 domain-containing protein n=1 Tax=Arenimonas metalli CF5-1 TaxID=1384056 RepID=A0A091B7Z7_9GAMM|nr:hypothetical protein [Arenimonas metalli]KFN46929.1 hypothetical protein N787_01135 [Arenimonas metalli CF5-1]
MTRIARRRLIALMLSAAGCLAALSAFAQSSGDRVARLTDLVVQTVPMGEIFETLAATSSDWPLQEKPGAVSAGQLACLRDELSEAGYRRMKRTEVVAYVAENPGQADADIAVLEDGGARMMSRLMMAGVEQERSGVPVDEATIMGESSPEELAAFMQMMTAPDQTGLRKLLGIGNAYAAERSAEENESAGEDAGADLATRVMMKAMSNCDVPVNVLFE